MICVDIYQYPPTVKKIMSEIVTKNLVHNLTKTVESQISHSLQKGQANTSEFRWLLAYLVDDLLKTNIQASDSIFDYEGITHTNKNQFRYLGIKVQTPSVSLYTEENHFEQSKALSISISENKNCAATSIRFVNACKAYSLCHHSAEKTFSEEVQANLPWYLQSSEKEEYENMNYAPSGIQQLSHHSSVVDEGHSNGLANELLAIIGYAENNR